VGGVGGGGGGGVHEFYDYVLDKQLDHIFIE